MSSIASTENEIKIGQLKGNLGPFSIALMVIATAAPLTVMVGVSPLIIGLGNGAAAPTDALIVTAVMLLFSIGFVTMSKHVENAGAFYSYIQKGLGGVLGLGAASLAVLSYSVIVIALEAYLGFVLNDAISGATGVSLPWWIYAFAIVAVVGFLGYRNIEVSTKILGIALCLEICVILFLDLAIFHTVGIEHVGWAPFEPATFFSGSPGLGILFAIFGFIGFESTVVYRDEATDPERSIPLATYIAVLFIGLLYFVSFWCVVAGIGLTDLLHIAKDNAGTMYLDLAEKFLGKPLRDVAQVLLISSLFAVVLSIHNVVARYKYVLGQCGVLPSRFGQAHADHASPHIGSALQTFISAATLIAAVVLQMDPVTQVYTWGAAAGTLGYMVIVALACVAVIAFFAKRSEGADVWRTKIAPVLAFLGLVGCLYIAFNNLAALTGSEGYNAVNVSIVALLIISFLFGSLGAFIMKTRAPDKYAKILSRI